MWVVLKTVDDWTVLMIGPFLTEDEAMFYADKCADTICPAGERWDVWKLEAPMF